MNYFLHARVLHGNPMVSITESEFQSLKQARQTLTACFALEEIYDLLVENYRELETCGLNAAVAEMTASKTSYGEHFEIRSTLNRKTLNFLSAARLYLDQFPQWMREAGADSEAPRLRTREAYDQCFEYRFMEALRNHAQHVGLAVHGVNVLAKWLPEGGRKHLQFSVSPYTSKSKLEADRGFKSSVLKECGDEVEILPAIRKYLSQISIVNEAVRSLIDPLVDSARQEFEAAIQRHQSACSEKLPGLAAVAEHDAQVIEEVPVFLNWELVRMSLRKKNAAMGNLERRFITSSPNDA